MRCNWRDKIEITRPADEAQWIGKLCWFWDKNDQPFIAVLKRIESDAIYKYITTDGENYICIEKDPDYWRLSCERLEQAQRQQMLF